MLLLRCARDFAGGCLGVPAQLRQCVMRTRTSLVAIPGAADVKRSAAVWVAVPALFVAISTAFALASPLLLALLRVLHKQRRLNARESRALEGLVGLEQLTIVEQPHPLMRLFFGGAHACAIENTVYLFEREVTAGLARHEVFHCLQYRREGGFAPFLGLYFAFTLYDLVATRFDARAAYARNPHEREARTVEDVRVWRASIAAMQGVRSLRSVTD